MVNCPKIQDCSLLLDVAGNNCNCSYGTILTVMHLVLFYFLSQLYWFWQIDLPLEEFEYLVDKSAVESVIVAYPSAFIHYGYAYPKHRLPFVPIQRYDCEESLEEGYVEEDEVESH